MVVGNTAQICGIARCGSSRLGHPLLQTWGAADILASDGLSTMLNVGGWRETRSAFPYTPQDEIEAAMMSNIRIDWSDDDVQ